MPDNWRRDTLPGIATRLARRPGHEAVRVDLARLIVDGLGREVGAIDHMACWAPARSRVEALFLAAILDSGRLRLRMEAMQPRGQGGARHFDNLMWELPIPEYDARDPLHRDLAALAAEAERVAAAVPLREGACFTTQRRAIREALAATGIAARIDAAVARLPGL
ncbi:MAG: hypothetical protein K2X49_06160 [Acetobacteraceae bacterium]|nr:hypothetical protein [Acetobacteraceae bacterium]